MRIIFILLLLSNFTFSGAFVYDEAFLNNLSKKLAKPFDFEQTIRTIIKIESNDGKYLVNLADPSCGLTHININTYLKRHNIKDTSFNRNKSCQDLINNPQLAIANALEELLFWKEQHCSPYGCTKKEFQKVIKSYNAGWNYNSPKANEYLEKFTKAKEEIYKKRSKK